MLDVPSGSLDGTAYAVAVGAICESPSDTAFYRQSSNEVRRKCKTIGTHRCVWQEHFLSADFSERASMKNHFYLAWSP